MLGSCKKVSISKDDTVRLDGAGEKKDVEERSEQIRSAIKVSTSDDDKEKLQERLEKLSGGGAASLGRGFFVITNNLWELRNECIEQSFDNNVSPKIEQRDRYKLLGRKENFILHAIIST
ncbi:chaperonin-60kD, ch60 [Dorcoceras hygrometricum]|uniref:Chaperonin-60kD, ch60 n=1 Tax=Dorcoceras hygrometricum TaxID=472368 RepID=A0A2Z7BT12_9LAMI|nr:chaperonin-60kD, ch60 [Dorcoceras hygrometricum]